MVPISSSSRSPIPPGHLSVLVVDDLPEIRQLVQRWLGESGHEVVGAESAAAGTRLMQSRSFDLIVTDILMPDGDGLEMIGAARRAGGGVRVLAMSGGGTYMPATDCLRLAKGIGADAVLAKPFNRAQLLAAVEGLLQRA